MSNTKKEWQNMSIFEKFMQVFVNVMVLIITAILPIFAYLVPVECDIDKLSPWCWVHPGTAILDPIAWVLWCFGGFWLSGVWSYIPGIDDDQDPWATVTKIAWACTVGGPLLIILF